MEKVSAYLAVVEDYYHREKEEKRDEIAFRYLISRYSILLNYKSNNPPKANNDKTTRNLLGMIRNEYNNNAIWVTPATIRYLNETIPWWERKPKKKT